MELKIEYLSLNELKPYEKNARKHQKDDLSTIKASIKEFGMSDPIGVWGENNIIVEGHGRYMACKELGIESVPVIHLDHLSDEQRRAYALAHNKTAEMSQWDFDLLGSELDDILDIDMSDFGFDLNLDNEEQEVIEDDYEPELPEEPKAKLGDIYQLGNHRLMCGDSTCLTDVQKLAGGGYK
jgi:ParB-like chromosome segregation protein Spo0J